MQYTEIHILSCRKVVSMRFELGNSLVFSTTDSSKLSQHVVCFSTKDSDAETPLLKASF